MIVLNLVLNGIPSILFFSIASRLYPKVLNLVINGIPSIQEFRHYRFLWCSVLNLVINGIPSILKMGTYLLTKLSSFKPCYKWNTFNTQVKTLLVHLVCNVLNLVINGIPSILGKVYNYSLIYLMKF